MKKYLLFIPVIMLAFACHDYKSDIDKLQKDKVALEQQATYKDSSIMTFISQFNDIEKNISAIETKQANISDNSKSMELKGNQVARINANIKEINDLMMENKAKIAALTKNLKSSKIKVGEFEKMVASLNLQLVEKDKQLADLNSKLATLNSTVDKLNTNVVTLTAETTERQRVIEDQTGKLHTAYYTTGTFKELETKKVVNKEGGFLGLGREKKLKNNFDPSAFNTIDITKTSTIPLQAKDAEVLTNHPSDSYTIEHKGKEVSNLQITDPEKFWKASKYLVVVVDK